MSLPVATSISGIDSLHQAKSDLQEEVDFLRHPLKYHNVGARVPPGRSVN